VLAKLTGGVPAAPVSQDNRSPSSGLPLPMQERVSGMLERMGLEEKQRTAVLLHLEKKIEANRTLMEARRALMTPGNASDEEITRTLAAYQEANKRYAQAVERLDSDLDEAIGYRKKPRLQAVLTGLGILGISPAAPFASMDAPNRSPLPPRP
jgi:hypothetical protein